VTLEEILETAGVDIHYGTGDEVNVCCPFCTERGESEDHRYRLGINTATGEAQCFNCSWKGRGLAYTGRQLCRIFGLKFRMTTRERRARVEKAPPKLGKLAGLPLEYEAFSGGKDAVERAALAYLKNRGISSLQIVRHKIGFAGAGDLAWRVIFPFVDAEGWVHGCAARAIRSNMEPKYLNTRGIKILWNAMPTASTAIVVEGVVDGLHVEQALLRERGMIAVARLGSSITRLQMKQLKQYDRIVVFPDRDRPGIVGASQLCTQCDDVGMRVSVVVPSKLDGRDPGSMSADEIVDGIHSALPWRKATEFRLRLLASRRERLGTEED